MAVPTKTLVFSTLAVLVLVVVSWTVWFGTSVHLLNRVIRQEQTDRQLLLRRRSPPPPPPQPPIIILKSLVDDTPPPVVGNDTERLPDHEEEEEEEEDTVKLPMAEPIPMFTTLDDLFRV
jgi:hypothetical protein